MDADYFSRKSMDISELMDKCTETGEPATISSVVSRVLLLEKKGVLCNNISVNKLMLEQERHLPMVTPSELIQTQKDDVVIGPVYRAVGCRPSREVSGNLTRRSKLLMQNFKRLRLKDIMLIRETFKNDQIVLPEEYHKIVIIELHENMAHLGLEKVIDVAQQRFYWPYIGKDVKNYIQKKCRCVVSKKPNIQEKAPFVPIKAIYPSISYT